jgi:hypothetical protein
MFYQDNSNQHNYTFPVRGLGVYLDHVNLDLANSVCPPDSRIKSYVFVMQGVASSRGDVTPPPHPEAALEVTPTRTPAASPTGAGRQTTPETPLMSPLPIPQPLPPPGVARSEDDGFFNAWSWLALLRS